MPTPPTFETPRAEAGIDLERNLAFNGVSARTGSYLFEPLSTQLADVARGKGLACAEGGADPGHVAELEERHVNRDKSHYGVKAGVDPTKLDQAGWGVIFPAVVKGSPEARRQDAIREALSPLLSLRRAQATKQHEHYYKEYRGALAFRPRETKQKYLARLGTGPGPADPNKVPYYLLIVASPEAIPFHVQYQLDVQYAVGRIDFETLDEYDSYARSVVAAETGGLVLPRELAFVGVANPDDMATQLSRENLVAPLADHFADRFEGRDWTIARYFDERATKAATSELFGGAETPALLFTASHGMGFERDDPRQVRHQGALLMQDWTGPEQWSGEIGEDLYVSADDIGADANLLGMIAFAFACYGGGTPRYDEFSRQAFKQREQIAEHAFVGGLPRRLLGHPKGGALAAIGHIERAWGYSFMWRTGPKRTSQPQLAVFESAIESLLRGDPVGVAFECFNERYAELASDLSQQMEALEFDPDAVDAYTLANMWTSNNDARGYAILGDPAVRLAVKGGGDEAKGRDAIELSSVARGAVGFEPEPEPEPEDAESELGEGSSEPVAEVDYGSLGSGGDDAGGRAVPGSLESLADRIVETIQDALNLEVRTYVSDDPDAAVAEGGSLATSTGARLRAFTRTTSDGVTEVIMPQTDGALDRETWSVHLEAVAGAQQAQVKMIDILLSRMSGLL